mgnify:CR=1 FL=1
MGFRNPFKMSVDKATGVVYLGDIIIFNSVEFWGGENPISPPPAD